MKKLLLTSTVALALVAIVSVNNAKAEGADSGISAGGGALGNGLMAKLVGGTAALSFPVALGYMTYTCAFTKIDCSKAQAHNVKAESDALAIHAYNMQIGRQDDARTAYVLKNGAIYGDANMALASIK